MNNAFSQKYLKNKAVKENDYSNLNDLLKYTQLTDKFKD